MVKYYQLKVGLAGAESKVWRSFIVESGIRLDKFQKILRCVMGWSGVHEHYFKIKDGWKNYIPELKEDSEFDCFSYEDMVLSDFLQGNKDVLVYIYDPCDQWEHHITIEKYYSHKTEQRNPYCLSGKGVCPPEDCGGLWGYLQMMKVMQDPYSTEFENVKRWLGSWVERQFSCNDVNNHFDDAGLYNERAGLPGVPNVNLVTWRDIMCKLTNKNLMQNCRALELPGTMLWTVSRLAGIMMEALKKRPMLLTKILSREDLEYLKFLIDARTTVKWNKGNKNATCLVKCGLASYHHDKVDDQLYVYTTFELGSILAPYWTKMLDSPQVEQYDRWDRIICGILFHYGVLSAPDLHKRWRTLVSKPLNYANFMAYLKKRTRLRGEVLQVTRNSVTYCCHYMMDLHEKRYVRYLNYTNINYKPFTAEEFYEVGEMDYMFQCVDMQRIKMYLELHIADAQLIKNRVIESWRYVQNDYPPVKSVRHIFKHEIEAGIVNQKDAVRLYASIRRSMPCWMCRGHRRHIVSKMTRES